MSLVPAQFGRVRGIGPFRGWKFLSGQYFTPRPGDLSLVTGDIAPATTRQIVRFVGEVGVSFGIDLAPEAAAAYVYWRATRGERSSVTEPK